MTSTFNTPALPKWPGLLVSGEPVTREQAAEVILRTSDIGHLWCNDRRWVAQVNEAFGIPPEDYDAPPAERNARYKTIEKVRKNIGCIEVKHEDWESELEYLGNRRIASAYIGGAHGWCDWEGNIFSNSYNIGKWPSVDTVLDEWQAIAAAFPFLQLRSQLLSGETCEGGILPVAEFHVGAGEAAQVVVGEMLGKPAFDTEAVINCLSGMRSEQGVTLEYLQLAIEMVTSKRSEG